MTALKTVGATSAGIRHRFVALGSWWLLVVVTVVGVTIARYSQSIVLYEQYAAAGLAHPGHAWPVEYPPASLLAMLPAALGPSVFALVLVIIMGVTWSVLRRQDADGHSATLWAVWILLGGMDTDLARYDPYVALALLLALVAAKRGRWSGAWAWSTVSACLKWVGLIVWPLLLVAEARHSGRWRWDRAAASAGVFAASYLLPMMWDGTQALSSFTYFWDRPLALGSLSATITAVLSGTGRFFWAFGGYNYGGPATLETVIHLGILSMGASLGVVLLWRVWRGTMDVLLASALAITACMLASSAFSPQYLLWVFPLWALVRPRRAAVAALSVAAVLTTVAYPILYDQLAASQDVSFARNVMLLVLVVVAMMGQSQTFAQLRRTAYSPYGTRCTCAGTGSSAKSDGS